jgi:hypothetical protein
MIIANPIYDVVFKRMLENERVAKFFIGTLLDQTIQSVEVKPQELTQFDKDNVLTVFRLDFIATIVTASGESKKVLIEVQKAQKEIDLMRFRNYLGEQYKKEDTINDKKVALPITTIYILGFTLPEIETPCLKVERNYKDLIHKSMVHTKCEFVEKLTHDSYIVQVERITDRYQTRLDKLLSVFEQTNFIDEKKVLKEFTHETDLEEVKLITEILHHSGTNPEERKRIEDEQEVWRTINVQFEKVYQQIEEANRALRETNQALRETNQALSEKDQALSEKDQALSEKDQALSEMSKLIEELRQKLKDEGEKK